MARLYNRRRSHTALGGRPSPGCNQRWRELQLVGRYPMRAWDTGGLDPSERPVEWSDVGGILQAATKRQLPL